MLPSGITSTCCTYEVGLGKRVIGVATVQYESLLKSKAEAKQRSLALTYSPSAQAQAQGHAIHPVLA